MVSNERSSTLSTISSLDKSAYLLHEFLLESGLPNTAKCLFEEMNWQALPVFPRSAKLPKLSSIIDSCLCNELCVDSSSSTSPLPLTIDDELVSAQMNMKKTHELDFQRSLITTMVESNDSCDEIICSGTDRSLHWVNTSNGLEVMKTVDLKSVHTSPILSIAIHPIKRDLMLTCSMDKTHCLLRIGSNSADLLHRSRDHAKYVVDGKWSPSGNFFATASYDHSVNIYSFDANSFENVNLVRHLDFNSNVESISFFQEDSVEKLLIASRSDNNLYLLNDITNSQGELIKLKLNDRLTYNLLHMSLSPNFDAKRLVLLSTDCNQVILYELHKEGSLFELKLLFNVYSIGNDPLSSHPVSVWHPSGQVFYCSSTDGNGGSVYVVKVCQEGGVIVTLSPTTNNDSKADEGEEDNGIIRTILYHHKSNSLITSSTIGKLSQIN